MEAGNAKKTAECMGPDYAQMEGAGAAGGLGFAFVSYLGASLVPGIDMILDVKWMRLPLAYYMGIQPDASLTKIGFAAPAATIFGIILNVIYYLWLNRAAQRKESK